ncbi:alpha/beta hydrolase [Niveibacterium sp. SC-1]|uniref:alpha/beta hydrolase n=1 Tax=Niveibacterium sp. SC-1 TaxID=3135646 RepID=UPI00311FC082
MIRTFPSRAAGFPSTRFLPALLLPVLLGACNLIATREESKTLYSATVLVGRIEHAAAPGQAVYVAAYAADGDAKTIAHSTRLHESGPFELIVPDGRYRLFAFADANANGRFDAGEDCGALDKPVTASSAAGGMVQGLDFALTGTPRADGLPQGTRLGQGNGAAESSTQIGAPLRFEDPRFSAETGVRGYWEPVSFFREMGGNVYFLEPYSPDKTPILFIHGASGSAQDWQALAAHIDRSRYQPWFFVYPSGASLDSMSYLLLWKLLNLQARYGFQRLYLTAHSMGGLVAEDFLEKYGANFPQITLFVSIATPWLGEPRAETGVRYSPAVVPSWEDLRPEGPFIKRLFARPQPAQTAYYLMFAHGGSPGLMRPNNDGTVTLQSQLRPQAQALARQVRGFDAGHASVLAAPELFAQYDAILREQERPAPAGRLGVQLKMPAGMKPPAFPLLMLEPKATAQGRILTTLSGNGEVGQIPPGDYLARVVAYGYASTPQTSELHVEAGTQSRMEVALAPLTVLSGFVASPLKAGTHAAGQERRPDGATRISRVWLKGPAGERSLSPGADAEDAYAAITHYSAGRDFASLNGFSFTGLAPGHYELRLEAEGYAPYVAQYELAPETNPQAQLIELQR